MKKTFVLSVLAATGLLLSSTSAFATFWVVGDLQDEQGDPGDWDPANTSLNMTDGGGGIYTRVVNNLTDGSLYKFKILDDVGAPPPAWGDPEMTWADVMAYGDADGSALITMNTNLSNGAGWPCQVWVTTDNAPLQVVGDFMDEAGGLGDWDPSDPTFNMTPQGAGYYTIDLTISTAGWYQFKATDGASGADEWLRQVGTDGMNNNAVTYWFPVATDNQQVTLFVDLTNFEIGMVPEPTTFALAGLGLAALLLRRKA